MIQIRKIILLATCLISIHCELLASSVVARPTHKTHPHNQRNTRVNVNNSDRLNLQLNNWQKNQLISILQENSHDKHLINPSIRIEIINQANSLPPGIQKRLAKGKGLPPGIAKKVYLPYAVNDRLNIPRDLDILVVGGSVIVVDPLTSMVIDLLKDIF